MLNVDWNIYKQLKLPYGYHGRKVAIKRLSVNRVSIGVQSFMIASYIRRIAATRRQRAPCAGMAKGGSFSITNIDIIYGIPGQTTRSDGISTASGARLSTGRAAVLYPLYVRLAVKNMYSYYVL